MTVIELDGYKYHSTPEQLENDARMQKYIEDCGYTVIRFSGKEVYHYPVPDLLSFCIAHRLNFNQMCKLMEKRIPAYQGWKRG